MRSGVAGNQDSSLAFPHAAFRKNGLRSEPVEPAASCDGGAHHSSQGEDSDTYSRNDDGSSHSSAAAATKGPALYSDDDAQVGDAGRGSEVAEDAVEEEKEDILAERGIARDDPACAAGCEERVVNSGSRSEGSCGDEEQHQDHDSEQGYGQEDEDVHEQEQHSDQDQQDLEEQQSLKGEDPEQGQEQPQESEQEQEWEQEPDQQNQAQEKEEEGDQRSEPEQEQEWEECEQQQQGEEALDDEDRVGESNASCEGDNVDKVASNVMEREACSGGFPAHYEGGV